MSAHNKAKDFQERFEARFGKKPLIVADAAYDAVMVLAAAMSRAPLGGGVARQRTQDGAKFSRCNGNY
jgi:ABC-type branched-subunit amino acid transport system substrate-binding protein